MPFPTQNYAQWPGAIPDESLADLSDDTINLINYQLTLLISYKLLSSY